MAKKPAAEGYKIEDPFFDRNYMSPSEEGVEYEEVSDSDPKDSGVQSPADQSQQDQQNESARVASGSAKSNFDFDYFQAYEDRFSEFDPNKNFDQGEIRVLSNALKKKTDQD